MHSLSLKMLILIYLKPVHNRQWILQSAGPRVPVRLGFPIAVVEHWFPALYPAGFH